VCCQAISFSNFLISAFLSLLGFRFFFSSHGLIRFSNSFLGGLDGDGLVSQWYGYVASFLTFPVDACTDMWILMICISFLCSPKNFSSRVGFVLLFIGLFTQLTFFSRFSFSWQVVGRVFFLFFFLIRCPAGRVGRRWSRLEKQ